MKSQSEVRNAHWLITQCSIGTEAKNIKSTIVPLLLSWMNDNNRGQVNRQFCCGWNHLWKTQEIANITMSERPTNRQRIELSLEKRIELIKCAESVPKPSLKALSSKFGIGKSTVGDILQKKEVYKAKYEKNSNPNEKCFDNILANLTNWMNLCGSGFAVHGPRTYQFQVQLSNKKPSYLQKNLTLPTLKVQMAGLTNGRNDTRSKALKWAVKALELILTQLMTTREESLILSRVIHLTIYWTVMGRKGAETSLF